MLILVIAGIPTTTPSTLRQTSLVPAPPIVPAPFVAKIPIQDVQQGKLLYHQNSVCSADDRDGCQPPRRPLRANFMLFLLFRLPIRPFPMCNKVRSDDSCT